jgi:hypothetical protein
MMDPDLPEVEAPEPMPILPLFPLLVDPELKNRNPLTPLAPAFRLRMATAPLLVDVPSPLAKLSNPPVWTVLRPENNRT